MTNYFLMSLAVADLLVCLIVMPFGAIVFFSGKISNVPGLNMIQWFKLQVAGLCLRVGVSSTRPVMSLHVPPPSFTSCSFLLEDTEALGDLFVNAQKVRGPCCTGWC